jgi:polyisoprenoid-binding protein YceI
VLDAVPNLGFIFANTHSTPCMPSMKLVLPLVFFFFSAVALSQSFKIDTQDAVVHFNYVSEATSGKLSDVSATLDLNLLDLGASKIEGKADVNSLSTGNIARDKHLKSKTYFNASAFPIMKFTGSSISKVEDHYEVVGTLNLKGFNKSVTFLMEIQEATIVLKTTIYADDFGVAVKKGRDESLVEIEMSLFLL